MLSLQMNDAAVRLLGLHEGLPSACLPGGIAPGLEDMLERGIVRRGQVLTWAGSAGDAEGEPSYFRDLTARECFGSSFHLEDFVPVDVAIADDAPVIAEAAQRTLLIHGLSFALRFARLVHDLNGPAAVRCIIGANETSATFRFHQIREGEQWHDPALDRYQLEKIIVADIVPSASPPSRKRANGRSAAPVKASQNAQGSGRT